MKPLLQGGLPALALLATPLCSTGLAAQDTSFTFSCTTFPPETNETYLATRFGPENVASGPVYGLDDGPSEGTILFPNDSVLRVEILWRDPTSKSHPYLTKVNGEHSRWRTPNGITIGAELRMLERANGRAFRLSGFRREVWGMVHSWAGGRLELPLTEGCALQIRLYPRPELDDPKGVLRQVSGHTVYSSGHPAMQELNPRVVLLLLTY